MKVVFFVQGMQVAASRYRVLQYLPYFEAKGIDTEVREFPDGMKAWRAALGTIRDAAVIFVQRKRLPLYVLLALRRMGKKIVYDFDDAVMFKNSLSPNPYSLRRKMSFRRMVAKSDLVIAGNKFLRSEAERAGARRIEVVPTPIDRERYHGKAYAPTDRVNIGWIGDHGSIHYMESYKDLWEEVGRRYGDRVLLTIICDTFIDTERIETRKIKWTSDHEIEDLASLDIGVMPLFDDLWSRGKCGFKIIQYLGVGVPAVCTPVGINRDVVEDGVNGFWATTREEWVEKLSALIEDGDLRERMGRAGRDRIIEGYTVQSCAPRLIEWVKGL